MTETYCRFCRFSRFVAEIKIVANQALSVFLDGVDMVAFGKDFDVELDGFAAYTIR